MKERKKEMGWDGRVKKFTLPSFFLPISGTSLVSVVKMAVDWRYEVERPFGNWGSVSHNFVQKVCKNLGGVYFFSPVPKGRDGSNPRREPIVQANELTFLRS